MRSRIGQTEEASHFFIYIIKKMKDTLLLKLTNACKHLTYITPETLDAFATSMATGITEEAQIDAAIKAQMVALESVNGLAKHQQSVGYKKKAEEIPPVNPPVTPPVEPPKETKPNGLTLEDLTAAIKAAQAPLLDEINAIKGGNAKAKMLEDAKLAISEKFQLGESEMAGSNYIFEQISNRDFENVDAFVNTYESEYNKLRAATGMGTVTPKPSIIVDPNEEVKDEWAERKKAEIAAQQEKQEAARKRIYG